ncbi:MAG: hypothetical protein NVV74_24390 [Magnetospirillum sp.]|nr:hypothetical protein [Magnetospirillum sp.]
MPIANFHVDVVLHAPASVLPGTILDRSDAGSLIDPLTGLDRLAVLALRFHVAHGVKAPVITADMHSPVLAAIGIGVSVCRANALDPAIHRTDNLHAGGGLNINALMLAAAAISSGAEFAATSAVVTEHWVGDR